MTNRIAYALHLDGWSAEERNIEVLTSNARRVLPGEFERNMEGNIYCPVCFTNLSRSPKDKDVFSNNRAARFNHIPRFKDVPCGLRTKQATGKTYHNIELARQAIDNDELAVIDSFMARPPVQAIPNDQGVYDDLVEDTDGPITDAPIGRHLGETFRVPSKITTIAGICRNFDRNLYKYYVMPGSQAAILLQLLLTDIRTVTGEDPTPRLYWGEVKSSSAMGGNPHNLRMTELYCNKGVKDFNIKAIREDQERKGIDDQSVGRIILFWGSITESGIGLCLNRPDWGEYSLLPRAYEALIRDAQ
ncbi:hypothetical protein [Castellaniella ginsengisoli]|uniref:Restriction endonuclease n=1 Tax=Castellaniella ginsengisoli TaxID=546114 RepID=A0AB39DBJ0_9BURK